VYPTLSLVGRVDALTPAEALAVIEDDRQILYDGGSGHPRAGEAVEVLRSLLVSCNGRHLRPADEAEDDW
jgi:hypothetical protein